MKETWDWMRVSIILDWSVVVLSHPDCNSDDDCPSCCQSPCAKSKAILESRVSCYSCCYGYWSRLSSLSVGISFHYHL